MKKDKNVQDTSKYPRASAVDFENFQETWIVIPPDGGWGWVVVAAAFVINFFVDGLTYCFGLFLEDISKDLKVHPTSVAWATSLMTGFYYFAGPLACGLTNKYGFRCVSISGTLITASTFVGASFLNHLIPFLILVGVISGIGLNMIYTPCLLIVGFYFEKWRALTTAISVMGTSIGIMAFPSIVNILMANYDWRTKFRIFSGIFLSLIILMFTFRPIKPTRILIERRNTEGLSRYDDESESDAEGTGWAGVWNMIREVRRETELNGSNRDNISGVHAIYLDQDDNLSYIPAAFATTSLGRSSRVPSFLSVDGYGGNLSQKVKHRNCFQKHFCCCIFEEPDKINRPMYRDDILYGGSMARLSVYNAAKKILPSQPKHDKNISYHVSVTRAISDLEIVQDQQRPCKLCYRAVLHALVSMLDYKLFKSPSFTLLVFSGFFTSLGIYTPYTFMIERCKEIGIDGKNGGLLITIAGFSSTIGRVLCGVLSCVPKANLLIISCVTLFLAGSATIVSCFFNGWIVQIVFVIFFGLNTAPFNVLRTVVLAEMMGLENLTNAFGINIMFYGIASFMGIPLASIFQNKFGKYAYAICFAGVTILISAILLTPLQAVKKWEDKRNERK